LLRSFADLGTSGAIEAITIEERILPFQFYPAFPLPRFFAENRNSGHGPLFALRISPA
jgi:hypothetical protein